MIPKRKEIVKGGLGGQVAKYPELRQRPQMKMEEERCEKLYDNTALANSSTFKQIFFVTLGQLVDETDLTKAWEYNVPVLVSNERDIIFICDRVSACISGYSGETFPRTLSIGIRGFTGIIGTDKENTNKIIVMSLFNISTRMIDGVEVRDLIYTSQHDVASSLGGLRTLVMEIYVDEEPTPIQLPISSEISFAFKINHVS